ncbi:MAG: hypothetical protein GX145_05995 [Clostridiaceae bacterium]|nr:hypothetical protein [Clostridiaceae bacterium]
MQNSKIVKILIIFLVVVASIIGIGLIAKTIDNKNLNSKDIALQNEQTNSSLKPEDTSTMSQVKTNDDVKESLQDKKENSTVETTPDLLTVESEFCVPNESAPGGMVCGMQHPYDKGIGVISAISDDKKELTVEIEFANENDESLYGKETVVIDASDETLSLDKFEVGDKIDFYVEKGGSYKLSSIEKIWLHQGIVKDIDLDLREITVEVDPEYRNKDLFDTEEVIIRMITNIKSKIDQGQLAVGDHVEYSFYEISVTDRKYVNGFDLKQID